MATFQFTDEERGKAMELFDAAAKAIAAIGVLALIGLQLKSSWRQEELLEDLNQGFYCGDLEVIRDECSCDACSCQEPGAAGGCHVLGSPDVGMFPDSHDRQATTAVTAAEAAGDAAQGAA